MAILADAFYVWLEDRPMPPWQYALAGLMALVIFALCLFPLAPAWLRSVVVYFFLGLLGGIFALILVRFLLFLVVFAFIGACLFSHVSSSVPRRVHVIAAAVLLTCVFASWSG